MSDKKETLPALITTLAEIENQLRETGELTPELEVQLSIVQENLPQKIDSYHFMINRMKTISEEYLEQADNFKRMATRLNMHSELMKEQIKCSMTRLDRSELQGENVLYKISNASPALDVFDLSLIPKDMTIVEVKPDNAKIRKALMEGHQVPGARLTVGKQLRVYNKPKSKL